MIVFDLQCAGHHVFEAWFGSSSDYEDQQARGLVACPICGSAKVTKAVMAPAVSAKSNRSGAGEGKAKNVPMQAGKPDTPAEIKSLLARLAKAQAKALEKSDYVGPSFAREARAMHDGEQDERPIHGETSAAEARELIEDGVPVAPLPLPLRRPETEN